MYEKNLLKFYKLFHNMKNHLTILITLLQYEKPFHYITKPLSQYKNPFDHNMKIPFTVCI